MDYISAMQAGFNDEFADIIRTNHTKLAGFLRAGRRPFKAATLLKRGVKAPKVKKGEMVKLSATPPVDSSKFLRRHGKTLALVGLGALGMDQAQRARRDWQMGRTMRLQQGY